jgi:hypothetical protein
MMEIEQQKKVLRENTPKGYGKAAVLFLKIFGHMCTMQELWS